MTIAVTTMGMMQVPVHKIVNVVTVWHKFMSTGSTVSVSMIVPVAAMIGRASIRIDIANGNGMFLDLTVMDVMQVSIVEIVGVTFVRYSHMTTLGAMRVSVGNVLVACSVHGPLTSITNQTKPVCKNQSG